MTAFLRFEVTEGIARLTLDNARRLNAVNAEMWQALPELLGRVATDPAIRVLVLAGAGDRAFCTGNDISEFDTIRADPEAADRYNGWQRSVASALQTLEKPIVAAIHGYCLGAGFEFALMSDFRLCAGDTRIGIPAVRLGLPYRLEDIEKVVKVVGLARAREMVLLGRQYGGDELLALGVATQILPDIAALDLAVSALARELAANAPLSLRAARIAFAELFRPDSTPDLARVKAAEDACYASADYAEGRRAKAERRAPAFTGR
ncbi:Enoyl-CoA hydratase/carnithine racemase [Roseomonas rosea]|uniref:Enoyl-CoA hydratase/carnithine racemase n=1 Tax=Muricoccus roseus TaxID=198092 RepID=A0A1M6HZD2_9PROT|nr:enoyl-CoA hydratase-related protein [Roseomonas rosea]SHJ27609.1 Enoyl-CoA hydratase/carnithine racemase [Roseomonas rosea]